MIFVTVGTQLGFDRLVKAMDALAPELSLPVVAQTGPCPFTPQNIQAHHHIPPRDFEALIAQSRLVVSHAGIGTVLTAARYSKPVVLMPRRADLGEHRNDHQLATVNHLQARPGILVARTEADLPARITEGLALGQVMHRSSNEAATLNRAVAQFIETGTL